jgi:hypothetical protein
MYATHGHVRIWKEAFMAYLKEVRPGFEPDTAQIQVHIFIVQVALLHYSSAPVSVTSCGKSITDGLTETSIYVVLTHDGYRSNRHKLSLRGATVCSLFQRDTRIKIIFQIIVTENVNILFFIL